MSLPLLTRCRNCHDLTVLLKKLDCTILRTLAAKRDAEKFGVKTTFSRPLYRDLLRYRRLLTRQTLNPGYLSIDTQDLITQLNGVLTDTACCRCETINAVPRTVQTAVAPAAPPSTGTGNNIFTVDF